MKDEEQGKSLQEMSEPEVVEKYGDFVEGLATKLQRTLKIRIAREDLVAYGYEGLLQAWRRYDPASKAAFTTYAYYRVRGAMYDGCRKEGWATRERRPRAADLAAVNAHLESNHTSSADTPPARTLSESVGRVSNAIGDVMTIMMVRQSSLEQLGGTHAPRQDAAIERKAKNERLNVAIQQLDENEQILIKRHHYYDEPLTVIAKDLNLSLSWCSRIHARALEKLRELLTDAPPADPA